MRDVDDGNQVADHTERGQGSEDGGSLPTPADEKPELPDVLRQFAQQFGLPEEGEEQLGRIISLTVASSQSGPLPRPEDFGLYDSVRPGSADDIMEMAKREQGIKETVLTGRVDNERLELQTKASNEKFGIAVSMVAVVGLIAVALVSAWLGQMVLSGVFGISGAALAAIRGTGRRRRNNGSSTTD